MNIPKSTFEGASLATEMTKRELIAMHIVAAYSNSSRQIEIDEGFSYRAIADEAVLQADALLVALHNDPEEDV